MRTVFVAALALLGLVLPAAAEGESTVFSFTGAPQTWTVPAGVTRATFDLLGAQGGNYAPGYGGPGGKGARVHATIIVTPGETLRIYVGAKGTELQEGAAFNGGGAGHANGTGGGGATDVRRAAALSSRLIVAGGGGGGGRSMAGTGQEGPGAPGGNSGTDGVDGASGGLGGSEGGKKGTATAGGAGGAAPDNSSDGGTATFGQGGFGGTHFTDGDSDGGGGGGGLYGGGGGGGGESGISIITFQKVYTLPGSGAGGSSLVPPGAQNFLQDGVRDGAGAAAVTFSPTARCRGRKATIVAVAGRKSVGTSHNDVILGTAKGDRIDGRGGNDLICAGSGNDNVSGGSGKDTLSGGSGRDNLSGGSGNDRLYGGPGNDKLYGGPGQDLLRGGPGRNTLVQ